MEEAKNGSSADRDLVNDGRMALFPWLRPLHSSLTLIRYESVCQRRGSIHTVDKQQQCQGNGNNNSSSKLASSYTSSVLCTKTIVWAK